MSQIKYKSINYNHMKFDMKQFNMGIYFFQNIRLSKNIYTHMLKCEF